MKKLDAAQLSRLEALLPVQRGNVSVTNAQVVRALIHVAEHGTKWRGLPERFGNWHTIYTRVRRWANAGVLDRLFDELESQGLVRHRIELGDRPVAKNRRRVTKDIDGTRTDRVRAAIHAAAEELFAKRGYTATRLEDVADAVGMTRPALFHYFPDKKSLFEVVLKDAFESLVQPLKQVLSAPGTIGERIEHATAAWVDAVVARPVLARLILRFAADGPEPAALGAFIDGDRIRVAIWSLIEQGRKNGELRPLHDDPFHATSAIVGTTVFYVGALAALLPHGRFEPMDPIHATALKQEMLHTVRRLLGTAKRSSP
jgi:TetR/AcrR family transcriptional regulator